MNAPLPLAQIQRQLQARLLSGDAAIAVQVAGDAIASTQRRLRVYEDAYRQRLIEVLGKDYPVLKTVAGAEAFADLAAGYLAEHPSQHYSVRHFGAALPAWLRARAAVDPIWVELAEFEWTQIEVFDAANADVVVLDDIGGLPPEAWPDLRLQLQPAARGLSLRSNAAALVAAHAQGSALPAGLLQPSAIPWLFWRRGFDVHWRPIDADESAALDAIRRGADFGELCLCLSEWQPADTVALRAASLLKRWIGDELLAGLAP